MFSPLFHRSPYSKMSFVVCRCVCFFISGMNIVIGTPGRLQHHLEHTPGFTADSIQILVLDEADRCLDLGFRAALDAIISYLPSSRQTMLFSATQTTSVTALARCSLVDPEYVAVHDPANDSAVTPPKLAQSYTIVSADQKLDVLYSFMTTHTSDKVLLFVASRKQVSANHVMSVFVVYSPHCSVYHRSDLCTRSSAGLFQQRRLQNRRLRAIRNVVIGPVVTANSTTLLVSTNCMEE
uniref:ATP-dependent RNA helicase n=1 Tax=Spongospora subterranea TaxID=70186 RepID=A0A0H5R4L9_9EUKA|eukprot:CRZ03019.1 hypothetical protein [Spongospora subterranea]